MIKINNLIRFISDALNSLLIISALIRRDYTIPILIVVAISFLLRIIADIRSIKK